MLKTYFVILCFLTLQSCKEEKQIVEKEDPGFSFDWLDTGTEVSFLEELCLEEIVEEINIEKKPEFTINEVRAIGRVVEGISKWKNKQGGWWVCGKKYETEEEVGDLALLYVVQIFRSAKDISDESYKLNWWGMLGVIANESRFDRCALGLHPREKAYALKILKKRKMCISHTEKEILMVVNHPKMRKHFEKTGFDLGISQMLSRFYSDEQLYDKQIELVYGCDQTAKELRNRAFWSRGKPSKKPWIYWPGGESPWYSAKIRRWALKLGARKDEI